MKQLVITKIDREPARMVSFDSLKEMKKAGYSDRNFLTDRFRDFTVSEDLDGKSKQTRFFLENKKAGVRIYSNNSHRICINDIFFE